MEPRGGSDGASTLWGVCEPEGHRGYPNRKEFGPPTPRRLDREPNSLPAADSRGAGAVATMRQVVGGGAASWAGLRQAPGFAHPIYSPGLPGLSARKGFAFAGRGGGRGYVRLPITRVVLRLRFRLVVPILCPAAREPPPTPKRLRPEMCPTAREHPAISTPVQVASSCAAAPDAAAQLQPSRIGPVRVRSGTSRSVVRVRSGINLRATAHERGGHLRATARADPVPPRMVGLSTPSAGACRTSSCACFGPARNLEIQPSD